ncbi:MAG: hypothetical protein ACRDZ4_15205 [Egibacteraceae bacterium]
MLNPHRSNGHSGSIRHSDQDASWTMLLVTSQLLLLVKRSPHAPRRSGWIFLALSAGVALLIMSLARFEPALTVLVEVARYLFGA